MLSRSLALVCTLVCLPLALADTPAEIEARQARFDAFERELSPPLEGLAAQAATPCVDGFAGTYPCESVDLLAFMPLGSIGGGSGNDIWGWTDPVTGAEYALMGRTSGVSFVDISDPVNPLYVGNLPTHTSNSTWRDLKVYDDHVFVVSEAGGHGMQVFDLTQLRSVSSPPVTFAETAHYGGFGSAHNIAINEATGYAFAVGTTDCGGGSHFVDISTPASPTFAGCIFENDYTHDAQCVVYSGPDPDHQGREVCFNSNENKVRIVDVTIKDTSFLISSFSYSGTAYTHQGWLTEDQKYFLFNDELDEQNFGHNTRTRILDVRDLDDPRLVGSWDSSIRAIDHNNYTHEGFAYQANYRGGLRILDLADVASANLVEVGFFDIWPSSNSASFNGAWSVYPYFDSGTVIISGIESGLFIVRPVLSPNFVVDPANESLQVCSPGSSATTIDVTDRFEYSGSVTLSASGLPATVVAEFAGNPVSVPGGSATMTVDVGTLAPGSYPISVDGTDGTLQASADVLLAVSDTTPGGTSLVSPADGAIELPLQPTFAWDPTPQALDYQLQLALDAGFTEVVYTTTVAGTQHTPPIELDTATQYYWRVRAGNACGLAAPSAVRSFVSRDVPSILLVDDDASPDVRGTYTAALDALQLFYDVWDTQSSDVEPNAATLARYDTVIWFTGDQVGGAAGPGAGSESALDDWLDGSGCLLVLSQDYHKDRGLTGFMQTRLGAASVTNDVGQFWANSAGPTFGGQGFFTLSFPYSNFTDDITPAAGTDVSFTGSTGTIGIERSSDVARTFYWSFGLEGVADAADRQQILGLVIQACQGLALGDPDGDSAPNGEDCAPEDAGTFAVPGRPSDLRVEPASLSWAAPDEPGGSSTVFDLLRSDDPTDFGLATCVESGGGDLVGADASVPPPGGLFSYVVRARNGCGGSGIGKTSTGADRTAPECP